MQILGILLLNTIFFLFLIVLLIYFNVTARFSILINFWT